MQQQQQQHQQPPQSQPLSQPPTLNSGASFSPNAITTEQIQKNVLVQLYVIRLIDPGSGISLEAASRFLWVECLDDNKNLIMAILENQNLGKFQECAQYQAVLQKNLMYLAAIADAQPPAPGPPAPQTSTPQMPPNSIPQQANSYMQQQQQHQAAQQQAQQQGGSVPKLPFQLNALRTPDQQQQLLQFQQQQLQAQMGLRAGGGGQNGMIGMHQAMQSALAGNPIGMKQDGSEAASGGDGQGGKSRS